MVLTTQQRTRSTARELGDAPRHRHRELQDRRRHQGVVAQRLARCARARELAVEPIPDRLKKWFPDGSAMSLLARTRVLEHGLPWPSGGDGSAGRVRRSSTHCRERHAPSALRRARAGAGMRTCRNPVSAAWRSHHERRGVAPCARAPIGTNPAPPRPTSPRLPRAIEAPPRKPIPRRARTRSTAAIQADILPPPERAACKPCIRNRRRYSGRVVPARQRRARATGSRRDAGGGQGNASPVLKDYIEREGASPCSKPRTAKPMMKSIVRIRISSCSI